jgi:predicted ATP-grasp superfamily ATP-dependent carboligase
MNLPTVALLDGQTIQALPIAESLHRRGYYVISLCESTNSYGYRTRFADKKIIVPSTHENVPEYHHFLINFLQKNHIDVLIPMNDYSALYMSVYAEELRKYSNFILPDLDTFLKAYDKGKLMEICRQNNYPHPRTQGVDLEDISEAVNYVGFPALIKPNQTTGARGFAVVNSEQEIREKFPAIIEKYGHCHLQQFITEGGKQYKVEIFIKDNELINATVIHKIRFYPEKGGSSCFNQTVLRNDLVEMCFSVLKTIGWEGFADFDLIEDPADEIVKIMEINPRVPACIKACFQADVDFAENIVSASLGKPLIKYDYRPGNYLRYFGLDLLWFLKSAKRWDTQPAWIQYFLNRRHFFQDGNFNDIKPLLCGTFGAVLKELNPKFRAEKGGMN